ncbi:MAG: hypothetical protein HQM08_26810 [Candidatus Riflebacteria bacterium]|nr:hypothetical protein [Candidatus Riflebacteria bacterium]
MKKLSISYQSKFSDRLIYDKSVFERIDPSVKIHEETKRNPLSSSAACLNVIGALSNEPSSLRKFLNTFGLQIDEIIPFPSPANVAGRIYNDKGSAIFEWVGPQDSPLNELGGRRGENRTSIDAFVIGKISGKICQILIEWKFTEGMSKEIALGKFSGGKGVERLRRYSSVLANLRRVNNIPFYFADEYRAGDCNSILGLADFSPDHLYQLMRMALLARVTTPIMINNIQVEDYRILHLSHSQNNKINTLSEKDLEFSPGLKMHVGKSLHQLWKEILSVRDREKFLFGYWDKSVPAIEDVDLKRYLIERYCD